MVLVPANYRGSTDRSATICTRKPILRQQSLCNAVRRDTAMTGAQVRQDTDVITAYGGVQMLLLLLITLVQVYVTLTSCPHYSQMLR